MPQLRTTSPRRIAGLIVASAALLFSAAACGGGSDADADAPTSPNGGGTNAFTAYTDCLKQNGVTITMPSGGPRMRPSGGAFPSGRPSGLPRPSGSAGPGGGFPGGGLPGGGALAKPADVDDATWEKAQSACASVLPSMRPGNGRGNDGGMDAAYRNCLQDHDVTMDQGGLNTADPAVAKAVEACRALAPSTAP